MEKSEEQESDCDFGRLNGPNLWFKQTLASWINLSKWIGSSQMS